MGLKNYLGPSILYVHTVNVQRTYREAASFVVPLLSSSGFLVHRGLLKRRRLSRGGMVRRCYWPGGEGDLNATVRLMRTLVHSKSSNEFAQMHMCAGPEPL